jgi:hypothetical protein
MVGWARAAQKPSDVGFIDDGFILPKLTTIEHVVQARTRNPEFLFDMPAVGLDEQRKERRRTIDERCETAAGLINATSKAAVAWCHLNPEGDLLEKLIPDAVQVSGSDSDEFKEETFEAFAAGRIRVLVSKPIIAGYGLNWQHCAHVVSFVTHSFEQDYQSVRRCYRFGQKNVVRLDRIATEGEERVLQNLKRKEERANAMFSAMIAEMGRATRVERENRFTNQLELPKWL